MSEFSSVRAVCAQLDDARRARQVAEAALLGVALKIADAATHDGYLPSMVNRREYAAALAGWEAAKVAEAEAREAFEVETMRPFGGGIDATTAVRMRA